MLRILAAIGIAAMLGACSAGTSKGPSYQPDRLTVGENPNDGQSQL